MKDPLDNLGDYNKMRQLLDSFGGDMDKLLSAVVEKAISKNAPKYQRKGFFQGVGSGLVAGGLIHLGWKKIKNRMKTLISNDNEIEE